MTESSIIVDLTEASRLVASCTTIPEAKYYYDLAEAARTYAQISGLGMEVQNYAAEARLRAERRMGEMIVPLTKDHEATSGGGRSSLPTGITHKQSSRWQKEAKLPEEEFEAYIATTKGKGEEITSVRVIRLVKEREQESDRQIRLDKIIESTKPLDTNIQYPIIYADPPWRYEHLPRGDESRAIENQYPTMTLEEICSLPIEKIAADDSLLYIWATAPKLAECMAVIEAWDFEYRTNLIWDKEIIGMGYYARNQHELLLIAKRGNIPPPLAGTQPSSVHREKRGKHSVKPIFYYEMIESAYPSLPKIELFSRKPREDWQAWGGEAIEND